MDHALNSNSLLILAQTAQPGMIWLYAGFIALVVVFLALDLGVFHRFNLFRARMTDAARPGQHFIVLMVTGSALSLLVFDAGCPAYIRIKGMRRPLTGVDATARILDEVDLSLNAYGKEKDLSRVTHLFMSIVEPIDALSNALAERFHLTVEALTPLNAGIEGLVAASDVPFARAVGALGAAAGR